MSDHYLKLFNLLFFFILTGCALPQKKAEIIRENESSKNYTITYPTELRGTYFFNNGSTVKYCAEPAPDVALDTLQKITAEIGGTFSGAEKIDGKITTDLSNKIVELAGRTQLVLLAREMLYRACELSINNQIDNKTIFDLYTKVTELVEHLGKADQASAEAMLLKEQTALEAAKNAFK